ncbi:MAG: asparagine synthase (glutamine-hydrolyzing) [Candidatus Nealsonbacteria bacterium]|nr:asparagine synthase (glutamine-hydrolyzing) [Candidatus Nealsonbacteria bacterium]
MCGITGLIGPKNLIQEDRLKAIASFFAHRGPDDEGVEIIPLPGSDQIVGLVHRRLSIIDLSLTGHQPMQDQKTGNWIVFNGEIYNYRELRGELEEQGHVFHSNSDTEVILKAYASYGRKCIEKLRGMFAFGLFDVKAQKIFLAVDRFGIKPLYFYRQEGLFVFSSEVRTLLKAEIVGKMIEPLAIESFLAYGAVQAPLTIIKGVKAMLPAQLLIYDCVTRAMHQEIYWKPEQGRVKDEVPFREFLLSSVRHHLVADVPIALFLSGGVDSSSLAILINEVTGGKTLDSFSVTFAEKKYAEGKYAKIIGERFCARHHEIQLSDTDLRRLLPQAIGAMDQPTVDGINVYVISKTVRDAGIKVVLSGQGGDEVFGGYSTFKRIPRIQNIYNTLNKFVVPPYYRIAKLSKLLDKLRDRSSYIESKFSQLCAAEGTFLSTYLILRQLFAPGARKHLLINPLSEHLFNGIPEQVAQELKSISQSLDLFSAISLFELRLYLANTLLRDGDTMSMAHGLEVRVPYLDHVLVERVLNVPMQEKVDAKLPKALLLRQVIDKIPREVYSRPKMGFTFPWENWLRGYLRPEIEEIFFGSRANEIVGFNRNIYQILWKEFLQRKKGITWARIWALYVLLLWIDKNIERV